MNEDRSQSVPNTTTTTTSSSTTTTTTTTTPTTTDHAEEIRQNDWEILLDEYTNAINRPTMFIANRLLTWYDELGADAVSYAITETAGAPRPSWAYCEAILRRVAIDQRIGRDYYKRNDTRYLSHGAAKAEQRNRELRWHNDLIHLNDGWREESETAHP